MSEKSLEVEAGGFMRCGPKPDVLAGTKLQENCAVGRLLWPRYRLILQDCVTKIKIVVKVGGFDKRSDLRGRVHRRSDRGCGR